MNMPLDLSRIGLNDYTELAKEQASVFGEPVEYFHQETFNYWSAHFGAILSCLHYHTLLQHRPTELKNYPHWSLSDFRGQKPLGFFDSLKSYLKNWGLQYFLLNFLNNECARNIAVALAEGLDVLNRLDIMEDYTYYSFEMAGFDSKLTKSNNFELIDTFPPQNDENSHVSKRADLGVIFSNDINSEPNPLVIFGEVEGNNGRSLLKPQWWENKHPDCLFGIGVVKSINSLKNKININPNLAKYGQPAIITHKVPVNGSSKLVILIEQTHQIIKDFDDAIEVFRHLMYMGADYKCLNNCSEPFREAVNLLITGFDSTFELLHCGFQHSHKNAFNIDQAKFKLSIAPELIDTKVKIIRFDV
jgi:hypothetical protein